MAREIILAEEKELADRANAMREEEARKREKEERRRVGKRSLLNGLLG